MENRVPHPTYFEARENYKQHILILSEDVQDIYCLVYLSYLWALSLLKAKLNVRSSFILEMKYINIKQVEYKNTTYVYVHTNTWYCRIHPKNPYGRKYASRGTKLHLNKRRKSII